MKEIKYCRCGCMEELKAKPGVEFNKGHKQKYAEKLKAQQPPLCACGCQEEVVFNESRLKWNKYKKGHSTPKIVKVDDEQPYCLCGCGQKTEWNNARRRWNKYIYNHHRVVEHLLGDQLCACGCGQTTKRNRNGRPLKYIFGHYARVMTEEHKNNMKSSRPDFNGENNPFYNKKHSKETKKKIAVKTKERFKNIENHPNWRGGKTPFFHKIRTHPKTAEWRMQVFERDNFVCQKCFKTSDGDLNAHHIYQFNDIIQDFNIKTIKDALNCFILWDINNGITLCEKCHRKTHSKITRELNKLYKIDAIKEIGLSVFINWEGYKTLPLFNQYLSI